MIVVESEIMAAVESLYMAGTDSSLHTWLSTTMIGKSQSAESNQSYQTL